MKIVLFVFAIVVFFAQQSYSFVLENCTDVGPNCTNGNPCVDVDWGVGHGVDCGWGGNLYGSKAQYCFFDELGTSSMVDTWISHKTVDFVTAMVCLILGIGIVNVVLFGYHRLTYQPYKVKSLSKSIEMKSYGGGSAENEHLVDSARDWSYNPVVVDDRTIVNVTLLVGFILFLIAVVTPAILHTGRALWPWTFLVDGLVSCAPASGYIFSALMLISGAALHQLFGWLDVIWRADYGEDKTSGLESSAFGAKLFQALVNLRGGINVKKAVLWIAVFTLIGVRVVVEGSQHIDMYRSCCERLLVSNSDEFGFTIVPTAMFFIAGIGGAYVAYRVGKGWWRSDERFQNAVVETINWQMTSNAEPFYGGVGLFVIVTSFALLTMYSALLLTLQLRSYADHHDTAEFEPFLKNLVGLIVVTAFIGWNTVHFYWNQNGELMTYDAETYNKIGTSLEKEAASVDREKMQRARARCNYADHIYGQHHYYDQNYMNPMYHPAGQHVAMSAERPVVRSFYASAKIDPPF